MELDMKTVSALAAAGVRFHADIPTPCGFSFVSIRPDELSEFVKDPAEFAAKIEGGSKAEYEKWLESGGSPQCGARTRKGKRCRNHISGGIQMDFPEWLSLEGGNCAIHDGDSSEEAKIALGRR